MSEQQAGRGERRTEAIEGVDPDKYHRIQLSDGTAQVVSGPLPDHARCAICERPKGHGHQDWCLNSRREATDD